MRPGEVPVVAVIPAYNAEKTLKPLLKTVLEQKYDDVYVLDDKSTDKTTEIATAFRPDVWLIRGQENLGAGGNRNRILNQIGRQAIIHFIDSDVRLNSERTPEVIQELIARSDVGFIGGLIREPDSRQSPLNYGPDWFSFQGIFGWMPQKLVHDLARTEPEMARQWRSHFSPFLKGRPNTLEPPEAAEVYWSCEGNMVIPSDVFESIGGYDTRYKYNEVLDLADRLEKIGLKRYFEPSIDVTHLNELNVGKHFAIGSLSSYIKMTAKRLGAAVRG